MKLNALWRKGTGGGIERLLPIACIAGAALLIASEFMTTFRLDAAGETTLQLSEAADRHNYAMLVIGLFAIGAVILAVYAGSSSRPRSRSPSPVGSPCSSSCSSIFPTRARWARSTTPTSPPSRPRRSPRAASGWS